MRATKGSEIREIVGFSVTISLSLTPSDEEQTGPAGDQIVLGKLKSIK